MTGDEFLELYPEGAMPRIRRWKKAESDLWAIKNALGLPQEATLIEVLETIEALIDLAERYEGLCK